MSLHQRFGGGAPVGLVSDLDDLEARAVACLRLWQSGADRRKGLTNELTARLGPQRAQAAMSVLDSLFDLCAQHARRPLIRHQVNCACLGADEACFAQFIATAARGEREDAMLIAMLIVRVDVAPILTSLAQQAGLALMQANADWPRERVLH